MYKLSELCEFLHFDSLTAMLAYCNDEETLDQDKYYESQSKGSSFSGVGSYEAANKMVTEGYPEGVKAMHEALTFAVAGMDSFEGKEPVMDVVGPVAITGAYCAGDPECMLTPADPMDKPVISLVVDCNAICTVSALQMTRRGAAILALATKLENSGRSVAIYANCSNTMGGSIHSYCVQVKKADADFNIHALSYALTCPAFFRRHGFRILERCEHTSGYGGSIAMTEIEGIEAAMGEIDLYYQCANTVRYDKHFKDQESANEYVLSVARQAGVIN